MTDAQTAPSATGSSEPQIKPPYILKFAQPDPAGLRRRLLGIWREMGRHRRAAFEALHAADAKPTDAQIAAMEALCLAGDFAFLLAAVVRRAEEYRAAPDDAPLEPFADFLERVTGLVLDTGLDWLEEANDDLEDADGPAGDNPGESLLETARRWRTVGPHPAPGEDAPTHPGPGDTCADAACVKSRAQHEVAGAIQDITAELFAEGGR